MPDVRRHPAYSEGFHDAAALEPLFDDAAPEYRAGWLAYWRCRDLFKL